MSEFGHVKVSRKFFASDSFWLEKREFSRAEAWLDLIQRAAWKKHTRLVDGTLVELERGELLASLRFLAEAWGWGARAQNRVKRFLDMLHEIGRISLQRTTQKGGVYLLVNYDSYQATADEDATPGATPARQQRDTDATKRSSKAGKAVVGSSLVPLRASEEIDPELLVDAAIRLANAGQIDNPEIDQQQLKPIMLSTPSRQAVHDWLQAGVAWETIEQTVYFTARRYKPSERNPQIVSMNLFNQRITDAHLKKQSNAVVRPTEHAADSRHTPGAPGYIPPATPSGTPTSPTLLQASIDRMRREWRERDEQKKAANG